MSGNKKHIVIGTAMLVVGVVLAATTGNVDTPVIALSKVGIVLAVLGAIELTFGLVAIMRSPSAATTKIDE